MATFTCSAALPGVAPKQVHVGAISKVFNRPDVASAAAGDVVLCCKIPNRAMVLDCAIRMGHRADTQATANVFLAKDSDGSATAIAQMGTQVLSATGGAVMFRPSTTWTPTRISLSDDAAVQYALLKVSVQAGTTTTSFSMAGYVLYSMDD